MRMVNGVIQDWNMHFDRLRKGVEFLYGPFTDGEGWITIFKNRLETKLADFEGNKVIRLTVYREQVQGFLRSSLISVTELRIHGTCTILEPSRYEGKTLKLRTCPRSPRPHWWPSYLKVGSYLETILCQKIYMKTDDDDVLFLNQQDEILESSVANIFVVRHNKLYTPPTGPNVLEGITRRKVLAMANDYFESYDESSTTMEQLLKADAVFGSNAIRGLFLVDRIDDYEINYSEEFLDKFNKMRDRVLT